MSWKKKKKEACRKLRKKGSSPDVFTRLGGGGGGKKDRAGRGSEIGVTWSLSQTHETKKRKAATVQRPGGILLTPSKCRSGEAPEEEKKKGKKGRKGTWRPTFEGSQEVPTIPLYSSPFGGGKKGETGEEQIPMSFKKNLCAALSVQQKKKEKRKKAKV